MTLPRIPAPPPPRTLTRAGASYAEHLATLVKDTGDPEYIARTDALSILHVRANVRAAFRAWEREWEPYEQELVSALRRAGIKDAEIARSLGIDRQNLSRKHGRRYGHDED